MLHYSTSGTTGPLLVLMHGVCNSSIWWSSLISRLQPDHRIAAIDMLGHGLSPRPTSTDLEDLYPAVLAAEIESIEAIVARAGEKATLIGHSMGGALATSIALARPDLVSSIILADPAWLATEQKQWFIAQKDEALAKTRRWQADPGAALADNIARRPHWSSSDHAAWVYGQCLVDPRIVETAVVTFDEPWPEVVGRLEVPTLVVTGDGPDCVLGQNGMALIEQAGNDHVETVCFAGATHAIVHDDLSRFERLVRGVAG